MKKLEKETILNFEVEDFSHYLYQGKSTPQSLKNTIHNLDISEEGRIKVLKRVDYAEKRIKKPLSNSETFLYIIIPFGVVFGHWAFSKTNFIDLQEEKRLGYYTRVKEFYLYSKVGLAFYFIVASLFAFIK